MKFFVASFLKKISSRDSTEDIDEDEKSQITESPEEAEKKGQDMNNQKHFDRSKILDSIKLGVIEEELDFVEEFESCELNNVMQASASSGEKCGGVEIPAIFEHPKSEDDAVIQYETVLPELSKDESLILSFKTGLRDGIKFDEDVEFNGVKFAIEINKERVFEDTKMECRWNNYILDLSSYVGDKIDIKFITNCNGEGNNNYDWALWGMPRILLLKRNIDIPDESESWICFQKGIFLGLFSDTDNIDESSTELKSTEFEFPESVPVPEIVESIGEKLEQESDQKLVDVAIHTYKPELNLVHLGTEEEFITTNEDFSINCVIKNNGKVSLSIDNEANVTLSGVKLRRDQFTKKLGRIAPGEEYILTWRARRLLKEKTFTINAKLSSPLDGEYIEDEMDVDITIESKPPKLTKSIPDTIKTYEKYGYLVLENRHLRVLFVRGDVGFSYCVLYAAQRGNYKEMAVYRPLAEFAYRDSQGNIRRIPVKPSEHRLSGDNLGNSSVVFDFSEQDSDGIKWDISLRFDLEKDSKRLKTNYQLKTDGERELVYFRGPMLYVGDSTFGKNKDSGLFPGLEFLDNNEPSSNERDAKYPINLRLVPHPYKITIPLMAIERNGALISLLWDAHQKWDGENSSLSAVFASPNFKDKQNNHLMGLFLPTVPSWVKENELEASNPYKLKVEVPIVLKAQIVLDGDTSILDAIDHWTDIHGMPPPMESPRSYYEEILLSRHGFMHSVWDEETQKSQHCVEWEPQNAPGFATLLWRDYLTTYNCESIKDESVKERVKFIAQKTIEEDGEEGLISTAGCHILKWEFPFYYGRLEPAIEKIMERVENLISSQDKEGGWHFHPKSERARELGKEGDVVLGTCAHNALTILKCARIIGKESILQAGLRALRFMDRFKIPRGAQSWECPLYEPDLLAAGYAIGAYVEAYNITGNSTYLEKAEYWARTGLPFLYFWNLQDRKGMRFASIPVFGTTFYVHSWFGIPVQWNGLVYAYYLQHLTRAMENQRVANFHKPSSYWNRIAEGITVGGMYQQWTDEEPELKGTYPDGFYGYCTERKGPHINPEDIMVNLYTLHNSDPDISTEILRTRDARIHVSSGAKVSKLNRDRNGNLSFSLEYLPEHTVHVLIAGYTKPEELFVDDVKLTVPEVPVPEESELSETEVQETHAPSSTDSEQKRLLKKLQEVETGWLYNKEYSLTFIKLIPKQEKVKLSVVPVKSEESNL